MQRSGRDDAPCHSFPDHGGGVHPERTTDGSRIDIAWAAVICVDPATRWLVSIGWPDESTLWYSQKRSCDVPPVPVMVQPPGAMKEPIVQLTYATWLAGYAPSSMRPSTCPVTVESAVSVESTNT